MTYSDRAVARIYVAAAAIGAAAATVAVALMVGALS